MYKIVICSFDTRLAEGIPEQRVYPAVDLVTCEASSANGLEKAGEDKKMQERHGGRFDSISICSEDWKCTRCDMHVFYTIGESYGGNRDRKTPPHQL